MKHQPMISNCCQDPMRTTIAVEGTGYFICSKCGKPCDIYVPDNRHLANQPPIETDGGEGMRQVLIPAARQYGRLSQQMIEFYGYCKAGKNVVFRMPEGDIYSPEALKAKFSLLQSQVLERVEGEEFREPSPHELFTDYTMRKKGYSQAKEKFVEIIQQVFKL